MCKSFGRKGYYWGIILHTSVCWLSRRKIGTWKFFFYYCKLFIFLQKNKKKNDNKLKKDDWCLLAYMYHYTYRLVLQKNLMSLTEDRGYFGI